MLTLNSLSKTFGHTKAVDSVSLTIERGSFVGVIGRSGAGKSTLLRMINRLNEPTSGSIVFEGRNIAELSGTELREWRRRCAMIFQQFNLVGRLDVLTNVLMGRLATTPSWRSMSPRSTRTSRPAAPRSRARRCGADAARAGCPAPS